MKKENEFFYHNPTELSNTPEELARLLRMVAGEVGVPTSMLRGTDLNRPLEFLGGKTLSALYDCAAIHPARQGRNITAFLLEQAGITATVDDLITNLRSERRVFWSRVPDNVIIQFLDRVAESLDVPTAFLEDDHFNQPLDFLNGGTLRGLVYHMKLAGIKPSVGPILKRLGITASESDVIKHKKDRKAILWTRVPEEVGLSLIQKAAIEVDKPGGWISTVDITRENFQFLGGRSLCGLYDHIHSNQQVTEEPSINILREKLGLPKTKPRKFIEPKPRRITRADFKLRQLQESFWTHFGSQEQPLAGLTLEDYLPWALDISKIYQNHNLGISREEIMSEAMIILFEVNGDDQLSIPDILHRGLQGFVNDAIKRAHLEKLDMPALKFDLVADTRDEELQSDNEMVFSDRIENSLERLSPLHKQLIQGVFEEDKTLREMSYKLGIDEDTLQIHYTYALAVLREELKDRI